MTRSYLNDWDRMRDMIRPVPRQRVSMNRSAPVPLTGSWQTVPFAPGASVYDYNTFPTNRFDFASQVMLANPDNGWEQAYFLSVDLAIQINQANTAARMSVRFAIPRPQAQGGPLYFPLPDSLGEIGLPDEISGTGKGLHFDYMVHSSDAVRQFGAQLQIKVTSYQLSGSGLLGGLIGALTVAPAGSQRPVLTDAVLNMYAS